MSVSAEGAEARFVSLAKVEDLERGIIEARDRERKNRNTRPDILTWQTAGVGRFLDHEPPERLFLFDDLIPRRTVGGIFAAGGVGKSFLLIQFALALATGRSFGPFRPTDRFRTLYIGAEDPEDELHRRIWVITKQTGLGGVPGIRSNLAVVSMAGQLGPLFEFDEAGNPRQSSAAFGWLLNSIHSLEPIDVLILDPMSRLYGLRENENNDATFWIHSLESLALEFDLTVIFSHHIAKAERDMEPGKISGRGASALRDGCRFVAGLGEMDKKEAKSYGVNHRDYLVFDIGKSNYAPGLKNRTYLKRGNNGVLEPDNLSVVRLSKVAGFLVDFLRQQQKPLSRRDLLKDKPGKKFSEMIKPHIPKYTQSNDLEKTIDFALERGLLAEEIQRKNQTGPGKCVLVVV